MVVLFSAVALISAGCSGLSESENLLNASYDLEQQNHLEEAIRDLDEAIQLDPAAAHAYYDRGNAYRDLGQYQRAILDYDTAIRLDPDAGKHFLDDLLGNICIIHIF